MANAPSAHPSPRVLLVEDDPNFLGALIDLHGMAGDLAPLIEKLATAPGDGPPLSLGRPGS
jgi:hypothetical protein